MTQSFPQLLERALVSIRAVSDLTPRFGIVLGSGLSEIARSFDGIEIAYTAIDGFPAPTVAGHAGVMTVTPDVVVMAGRFHHYEGRAADEIVLPVHVMARLGVSTVVLTNAAGAVNAAYSPGDLVVIADHLNLIGMNPLIGPHIESAGPRFPDMTDAYEPELRALACEIDPSLPEGVYAALTGPNYETPAEIRMLRTLGADLVGMSTVPECIAARALGLRVFGLSCVTNMAAGMSGRPLDHKDVVATGAGARARMQALLHDFISRCR
ncbi:MAG: purine-nucleoside phosphorylase [Spirochaetaceae bacterium]|nr:MAG: purine-nucleoside phosphorylase [Spirochaetaceae bacterium]